MTTSDSNQDRDRHRQLYDSTREDLYKRQLSNAEHSDRAILTLSTAFLALSISFISDLVPIETARITPNLFLSWGLFTAAIVFTVTSFAFSQEAIVLQLKRAREYYLERKTEAANQKNPWAVATVWLNRASGFCFVLATILTVVFVVTNLQRGETMAADRRNSERFGAPVNKLDTIISNEEKAVPVPTLTPVDNPTSGGSSANDSGSTSNGSSGGAEQGSSTTEDGTASTSNDES